MCVCAHVTACMHIHVSASAPCICSCLLLCTLSDYCSPLCQRVCNNGSSGEDCAPRAGGRGCPLPSLKTRLLSALRRNKSFIWFVVFLTKGSWSRNKALLSTPLLHLLPPHLSNTHYLTLSCESYFQLASSHFPAELDS